MCVSGIPKTTRATTCVANCQLEKQDRLTPKRESVIIERDTKAEQLYNLKPLAFNLRINSNIISQKISANIKVFG